MNLSGKSIIIIEEQNCPLYNIEDEFSLSGISLVTPKNKPVCLILVKDITTLFDSNSKKQIPDSFYCSGCTGKIKLKPSKSQDNIALTGKDEKDLSAIAEILSNFSIFQSLSGNNIKEVISYLKLHKYSPGEIVIKKGEPGKNLYIIASGKVEVLGDESVNIAYLESGEVFGEMSLLSGEAVGATIKVIKPSRILYISGKNFRKLLNKFPSLQLYFTRLLAKRLAKTNIARAEEFSSGMIGKLSEMPPAELFQTLNTNQKTGMLILDLNSGTAKVSFRDGELINAKYKKLKGIDAFFEILKEKQGRFKFKPGLTDAELKADILGDFMWLLMEGARMIDEAE